MNYTIQTNIVLRGPYAIGDGVKILAIESKK